MLNIIAHERLLRWWFTLHPVSQKQKKNKRKKERKKKYRQTCSGFIQFGKEDVCSHILYSDTSRSVCSTFGRAVQQQSRWLQPEHATHDQQHRHAACGLRGHTHGGLSSCHAHENVDKNVNVGRTGRPPSSPSTKIYAAESNRLAIHKTGASTRAAPVTSHKAYLRLLQQILVDYKIKIWNWLSHSADAMCECRQIKLRTSYGCLP